MQTEEAQIPAIFYESILNGSITLSPSLRFYSLASMVVQQALGHLDPQRLGLTVNVIQCMPPVGDVGVEKVRSLREVVGMGTPPWNSESAREDLAPLGDPLGRPEERNTRLLGGE